MGIARSRKIGKRGLGKHGIVKLRRSGIFVETTTKTVPSPVRGGKFCYIADNHSLSNLKMYRRS